MARVERKPKVWLLLLIGAGLFAPSPGHGATLDDLLQCEADCTDAYREDRDACDANCRADCREIARCPTADIFDGCVAGCDQSRGCRAIAGCLQACRATRSAGLALCNPSFRFCLGQKIGRTECIRGFPYRDCLREAQVDRQTCIRGCGACLLDAEPNDACANGCRRICRGDLSRAVGKCERTCNRSGACRKDPDALAVCRRQCRVARQQRVDKILMVLENCCDLLCQSCSVSVTTSTSTSTTTTTTTASVTSSTTTTTSSTTTSSTM